MLSGQENELYLTLAKWVLQIGKLDSFAVKVSHKASEGSQLGMWIRIFTNLGVCKTPYFILSHEFSPDGELSCEYIMI